MKILFAAELYPWPPTTGNPQRVYHILAALAKRHEVTLVSIVHSESEQQHDPTAPDPLPALCARIIRVPDTSCAFQRQPSCEGSQFWAFVRRLLGSPLPMVVQMWACPELVATLKALRAEQQFDAVWVERCYIAELVRRAGFQRLIVDLDDIQSVALSRLVRQFSWSRWKALNYADLIKLFLYEQLLSRRFERLVVCKESDRHFFALPGKRVVIVPNGVDTFRAADRGSERPNEILFVGFLRYTPNVDAVMHFATHVLPILRELAPGVRFTIVGKDPAPVIQGLNDGKQLVVEAAVADVRPYYEAASVVVVPMRLGSGTRIKLLEALAYGKAVVTTSIGAEGIDVRDGIDLAIADDPRAFAYACARLLGDQEARERLGTNGRERVLARYNWHRIAEDVENAIAGVTANR